MTGEVRAKAARVSYGLMERPFFVNTKQITSFEDLAMPKIEPLNVLVLVHGMTIDGNPTPADIKESSYAPIKAGINEYLAQYHPGASFTPLQVVEVFYGMKRSQSGTGWDDELLSDAENGSAALTKDASNWSAPIWGTINAIAGLKQNIARRGLADCVYYCSDEGEWNVRWAVYSQVLDGILPMLEDGRESGQEVRLHFVAHSLGVTVTHDLAYMIFGSDPPDPNPDQSESVFLEPDTGTKNDRPLSGFFLSANYRDLEAGQIEKLKDYARKLADPDTRARLKFGSFHGMEGQLPLFVLRNADNVRDLAADPPQPPFDARSIGVDTGKKKVQLQFFYAPPDILGFGSIGLYKSDPLTGKSWGREEELSYFFTAWQPGGYHTKCWTNSTVHDGIAKVIAGNLV
jgi:hypothetical protein